jgi:hypothetical protein
MVLRRAYTCACVYGFPGIGRQRMRLIPSCSHAMHACSDVLHWLAGGMHWRQGMVLLRMLLLFFCSRACLHALRSPCVNTQMWYLRAAFACFPVALPGPTAHAVGLLLRRARSNAPIRQRAQCRRDQME